MYFIVQYTKFPWSICCSLLR